MNEQLDNLLNTLLNVSDDLIDGVKLVDGTLLFRYREARFRITKSITEGNSVMGYLKVSQRSPFGIDVYQKYFEDVNDFYIKVTMINSYPDIRISNYLELSPLSQTPNIDSTLT